jgi:hypothetical protein
MAAEPMPVDLLAVVLRTVRAHVEPHTCPCQHRGGATNLSALSGGEHAVSHAVLFALRDAGFVSWGPGAGPGGVFGTRTWPTETERS